jgi:cbb3-type cytochrome oxidase subunit 3
MTLIAILLLSLGCLAFIFWPDRNPFVQADKNRVDYLRERKDAIYENLRDLSFEHLAGKFPETDYNDQRRALEEEAAATIAEIESLTARGIKPTRTRA